ncbi:MAG: hypothetical protein AAGD38_13640 [Acidobacteriota bacterium]
MLNQMVKLLLLVSLVSMAGMATAEPTTYTYTGNPFDTVTGPPYTTSNAITGSVTTAAPLPRNLPLSDQRALVTSFSFTDGVQTRTDGDSEILLFEVATDDAGNLVSWAITFTSAPLATMVGEIRDTMDINSTIDQGGTGACVLVTNGLCSSFSLTVFGNVLNMPGMWQRSGPLPPVQVAYSYQGNNFDTFLGPSYNASFAIAGEILLGVALAPNLPLTDITDAVSSFDFFDGVFTYDPETADLVNLEVGTDGLGNIDQWRLFLVESPQATMVGQVRQNLFSSSEGVPNDQAGSGPCVLVVAGVCDNYALDDLGSILGAPGLWSGVGVPALQPTPYGYTGRPFTAVTGPPYNTSQSVTGGFTTSTPLPPNLAPTDISSALLSYAFHDGVQTRTELDSVPLRFTIGTDAQGRVELWGISLTEAPLATMVGEVRGAIDTTRSANSVALDQGGSGPCGQVDNGVCSSFTLTDFGNNFDQPGTWIGGPGLLEIPTLGTVGLIGLIGLLALAGVWRMRR